MFNLRLCNAVTIRYSQLKFGPVHLCGMDYKYFSPHYCKCNSFSCTAAIRCGNACHGPIAIASIQVASTANSIHRVKRASPTRGGRWLAQTNYDTLMTHHTTENSLLPDGTQNYEDFHWRKCVWNSGLGVLSILLTNQGLLFCNSYV